MLKNLAGLWRHRALAYVLVSRELKARYRGSVLGFFWSLLNPLLMLVVYTIVFQLIFPGRSAELRQSTPQEINATSVIWMDIERASAKIRAKGVVDDDEDYLLPIYAERLPVRLVIGEPEACPRLRPGVDRPDNLSGYRSGRSLEEAAAEAHATAYDGNGGRSANR